MIAGPFESHAFRIITLDDRSCSPRCARQLRLPELRPFFSFSVGSLASIKSTNSKRLRLIRYFLRESVHCSCRFSRRMRILFQSSFSLTRLALCTRFCTICIRMEKMFIDPLRHSHCLACPIFTTSWWLL